MATPRPLDVIDRFAEAMQRGDLATLEALYEPGATLVARPGELLQGSDQRRPALEHFLALRPTLTHHAHELVETGDLALFCSHWTLSGTDAAGQPVSLEGRSADILRRQSDGNWLLALDNPWGAGIVP